MRISYEDMLLHGVNADKRVTLTTADRIIYRPIGFILAPLLFNKLRLTPNMVSIASLFVAILGFTLICLNSGQFVTLMGCAILTAFMILDCADGSIARVLYYKYKLKNPLGEFFDAFVGYFFIAGLWTSLGYNLTAATENNLWYIIGSISSLASIFARTSYLKLALVKRDNGIIEIHENRNRKSVLFKIYKNLDWGGWLLFIIPAAIISGVLEYVLLTMMAVNFAMAGWMCRFAYVQSQKYCSYTEDNE